jgi:hypothetical protein
VSAAAGAAAITRTSVRRAAAAAAHVTTTLAPCSPSLPVLKNVRDPTEHGGRNFSTTVEGDGGKVLTSPSGHTKWTLAEEFEWEYEQFFADPGSTCPIPSLAAASAGQPEPPWLNPVKTTIEGYEAWTQDDCAQLPQPDSPEYRPNFRIGRQVWVLDGDMTISLAMSVPDTTLDTSAQLIPFVEQIMRKYASAK